MLSNVSVLRCRLLSGSHGMTSIESKSRGFDEAMLVLKNGLLAVFE